MEMMGLAISRSYWKISARVVDIHAGIEPYLVTVGGYIVAV